MKKFVLLVTVLLVWLTSEALLAQERVPIKLSGEQITTGVRYYEYVREEFGEESPIGTIYETVKNSEEFLLVVYRQVLPMVNMTDSLIVNLRTFEPISYTSVLPYRQNIRVHYIENGMRAEVSLKRQIPNAIQDTSFSAKFEGLRYDSHWLPPLVYALQASDMGKWEIPVYSYNNKEDVLRINFLGEEEMSLHGNIYQTVKYEVSRENSENIFHYWIEKEANRLVQTRGVIDEGRVLWLRLKPRN